MEEHLAYLRTVMDIASVQTGMNGIRVRGSLHEPAATAAHEIIEHFRGTPYTPLLDRDKEGHVVFIGILPQPRTDRGILLNVLLFIATIITTMFAGAVQVGGNPLTRPADLLLGIPFSFSIMAILTAHELGHFFVSQGAGMVTSLPYFIPMPMVMLGTMGAIIRMKSIVPDRRSLLRVGMAGPLAGFLVALPVTVIGIMLSRPAQAVVSGATVNLGESILFYLLRVLLAPDSPSLLIHPMGFAGWIGLLITSMNLLPIGQLDGGHIGYSLLLRTRRWLYIPLLAGLAVLGIWWPGWIIWGALALIIGRHEPVIQDAVTPLGARDYWLAALPLAVLVLTFTPVPITVIP